MKSKRLTIVLPTYNESLTLKSLLKNVMKLNHDIKIIVVDDDSPDGTGKIADSLAKEYRGKIFALHRKGKLGLGSAYVHGFDWALDNLQQDYIMSMDGDWSHHPRYIPQFLEKMKDYDVVVGSRYAPGGGVDWGLHRKIISWGANTLSRLILGLKVSDVTNAFRCYREDVIKSIPYDKTGSDGFAFLEELLVQCKNKGYKMGQIPIFFKERKKGQSKLNKKEILEFAKMIGRNIKKNIKR